MARKRLEEYVKYTKAELDSYASTPGSCVHKINSNRHYALDPYILSDLKIALPAYILKHELGYYDSKLRGVLLATKNIKVLSGVAALRADDPHLHIDVNADCYVFRPEEGAELTGVVKYIARDQVSVVLYRVFNARIKFKERIDKEQVTLGKNLTFRVRSSELRGTIVTIQGELLSCALQDEETSTTKKPKKITFQFEEDENVGTSDSGIVEDNKLTELDELLNAIKNEPLTEEDLPPIYNEAQKNIERKLVNTESPSDQTAVANASIDAGKKRKRKSSNDSIAPTAIKTELAIKIKKEKTD